MKSYRERRLYKRVQVARVGPDGKPLRGEGGQVEPDVGGQWFLVVATGADRARLLPVDHVAFFAWKAEQATRALQAKGKAGVVTPERLYDHYVTRYTKPSETYAPPGQPAEFTIVLSKQLCVNLTHGAYGGASRAGSADVLADDLSVLAGLMSEEVTPPVAPVAPPAAEPAPEEPATKKRKGKAAHTPEQSAEVGAVSMADLLPS